MACHDDSTINIDLVIIIIIIISFDAYCIGNGTPGQVLSKAGL